MSEPSMRWLLRAVIGVLCVATHACGSSTSPQKSPMLLAVGNYTLRTIDGQALPFNLDTTSPSGLQIVALSATLTIAADSTYVWTNTIHSFNGPGLPPDDRTVTGQSQGVARTTGQGLTLYTGAFVMPAAFVGSNLLVTNAGRAWLFVRQ